MKYYKFTWAFLVCLFFSTTVTTQAQSTVACEDRLIIDVDFSYIGSGTAPERWTMSQANSDGVFVDEGAFAFVADGDFSPTRTQVNAAVASNTTRQYAIVENPRDLSPQYANIPTNGMLVINPMQGNADQFAAITVGGLIPGREYFIEIKLWNLLDFTPSNGCCWNQMLRANTRGNGNNPHDGNNAWGQSTSTNGNFNWDMGENMIQERPRPNAGGTSIVLRGRKMLGNATTGFTVTLSQGANGNHLENAFVMGIEYIKIYGCQEEKIITNTGVQDGGKVCETSELRLTAQGLGSANYNNYRWTEIINGVRTPIPGSGRTVAVTTPAGKGTRVTYEVVGEYNTRTLTIETALCCYDVGDRIVVLEYNFPFSNTRPGLPACANYTIANPLMRRSPLDGGRSLSTGLVQFNTGYPVRIGNSYTFVCQGAIPDEDANAIEGLNNTVLRLSGYAVIANTFTDPAHFGGWRGNGSGTDGIGLSERTFEAGGPAGTGMLCINAARAAGVFFEYDLPPTAVCDDGSSYQFSAWYASADPQGPDPCNITFQLVEINGAVETVVEQTSTGNYGYQGDWAEVRAGRQPRWQQTTLVFTTQPGRNYMVRLRNNASGVSGNDVLIDDILITRCLPKIDFFPDGFLPSASEAEVCSTEPLEFKMEVPQNAATPNGSFADLFPTLPTLYFQLQVCDDYNEVTGTGTWTLLGAYQSTSAPYTTVPTFLITPENNSKWYRVKITDNASTVVTLAPPSRECGVLEFYTRMFKVSLDALNISVAQRNIERCAGAEINLVGQTTETGAGVAWGWAKGTLTNIITGDVLNNTPGAKTYTIDVALPTDSGTYFFIVQRGDCLIYEEVKVRVLAKPNLGADFELCQNGRDTIHMTPYMPGVWTSSAPAVATVADSIVTAVSSGTSNIIFTSTAGGCKDTVTVTVFTKPTINITLPMCEGTEQKIEVTPPIAGTFTSTNLTVATISNDTLKALSSGTTKIAFSTPYGCHSDTITVTVSPTPRVNNILPDTICSGSNSPGVTLVSTPTGATYTWTAAASANVSGATLSGTANIPAQPLTVTGGTPGTVTYTITPTLNGCTGTDSTYVLTINPIPVITGATTVAIGDSITLSATPTGGTWSSSDPSIGTIGTTDGKVKGISGGQVTMTYTVDGCSAQHIVRTSLNMGRDTTYYYCPDAGDVLTLTGSAKGIDAFAWYKSTDPEPNFGDATPVPSAPQDIEDVLTLTGNDVTAGIWYFKIFSGIDSDKQTFTIIKHDDYTFSVGPTSPILACESNTPVQLTASPTGTTTAGGSYVWGTSLVTGNTYSLDISSPTQPNGDTIRVVGHITPVTLNPGVRNSRYCPTTQEVVYAVGSLAVTPSGTWDEVLCKGSNATLALDVTDNIIPTGASLRIEWYKRTTGAWQRIASNSNLSTLTETNLQDTTHYKIGYSLVITANQTVLCTDTIKHTIAVPNLRMGTGATPSYCVGETMTLTGETVASSWVWKKDGNIISTPTGKTYSKTFASADAGTYRFIATDNGCSDSTTFVVTQKSNYRFTLSPNPVLACRVAGGTIPVTATTDNINSPGATGVTYDWSGNGGTATNTANNVFNMPITNSGSDSVRVKGRATNYCETTQTIPFTVVDMNLLFVPTNMTLTPPVNPTQMCKGATTANLEIMINGTIPAVNTGVTYEIVWHRSEDNGSTWTQMNTLNPAQLVQQVSPTVSTVYRATLNIKNGATILCSNSVSRTFTVIDLDMGTDKTETVCESGTITLTGNIGSSFAGTTFEWKEENNNTVLGTSMSFTTPSLTNNTTYYFIARNGTCVAEQKFVITVKKRIQFTVDPTSIKTCKDVPVQVRTESIEPSAVTVIYTWWLDGVPQGDRTNYEFLAQTVKTGEIAVQAPETSTHCASIIQRIPYTVNDLEIKLNVPNAFCPGDDVTLEAQIFEYPSATGIPTYTWYEGANQIRSGSGTHTSITVNPTGETTYRLEARTTECSAEIERTIDMVDISIKLPLDTLICPGERISVSAIVNAQGAYTINWTKQGDSDMEPLPMVLTGNMLRDNPTERTLYTAYYLNNNCLNIESFEVDMHPVPEIIRIDEIEPRFVHFIAEDGTPPYKFTIDQRTFAGSYSDKLRIGNHIVYVRDLNNCEASAKFTISEPPLIFPPFFSPESEIEENRVWKIKNLDVYDQIDFQIHDRFGKAILTATTPDKARWDGKVDGKIMPSTDYWYVLKIREIGREYIGHFTLIRQGQK